jgi:hypothetical protein
MCMWGGRGRRRSGGRGDVIFTVYQPAFVRIGGDKRQVEYSLCWTRGDEGNEFKVGAGMREWVLWYVGICVTA